MHVCEKINFIHGAKNEKSHRAPEGSIRQMRFQLTPKAKIQRRSWQRVRHPRTISVNIAHHSPRDNHDNYRTTMAIFLTLSLTCALNICLFTISYFSFIIVMFHAGYLMSLTHKPFFSQTLRYQRIVNV